MATFNAGRIALNHRGQYSETETYNRGDDVLLNGVAYHCITNGTTGLAPPAAPWVLSADASPVQEVAADGISRVRINETWNDIGTFFNNQGELSIPDPEVP